MSRDIDNIIYRIYNLCKNRAHYGFDEYSFAFSSVFVVIIVAILIYMNVGFSNMDIDIVNISLTPSMIAIIIILGIQIIINIIAQKYATEQRIKYKAANKIFDSTIRKYEYEWQCKKCYEYNSSKQLYCIRCGSKNPIVVSGGAWVCIKCFEVNPQNADRCEYCDAPKPKKKLNDNAKKYIARISLLFSCACIPLGYMCAMPFLFALVSVLCGIVSIEYSNGKINIIACVSMVLTGIAFCIWLWRILSW